MANTEYAIELDHLSKHYRQGWRRTAAVRDLSLAVTPGEAFGFVGPNGAGKSTAIKMLMGLVRPSEGRASLFGVPATRSEARINVGYVPETPLLYEHLTPLEILESVLALYKQRIDNPKQHCMTWLERLGLDHVAKQPIRRFSKGMVQRTALAQALVVQPRLLVLDEPLSGLDPLGRKLVVDVLFGFKRAGGTLFFSSHVLFDVERIADRFGLIHRGELMLVQTPAEISASATKVAVRSFGEPCLPGMELEPGGRCRVVVEQSALWDTLEQLRTAGHRPISVEPMLSLESVFVEAVSQVPARSLRRGEALPEYRHI